MQRASVWVENMNALKEEKKKLTKAQIKRNQTIMLIFIIIICALAFINILFAYFILFTQSYIQVI